MNESELWDKKYKFSRTYKNKEEIFRFSLNNRTILAIEPYVKDGMSILEVGSGTGELISYIANKYTRCSAYGLDFSSESISHSINTAQTFNIPISFLQSDIKQMPFEDETFDIVFGDQVIGHIYDPNDALKEINRVTKKGGIVAFSIGNKLRPDY